MRKIKDNVFSAVFISPAFIIYTIFIIVPLIMSLTYSFTKWNGGSVKTFIGLKNYIKLFTDEDYWQVMKNTGILTLVSLIVQVSMGLVIAYMVYKLRKGFKLFRAVYFLPVVIAPVSIGVMFVLFYNSEFGPINVILDSIGLSQLKTQWLSNPKVVLYSVIAPIAWQYIGEYFIILLAALQSIPRSLLESAEIDGASSVKQFFHIIIPLLWDVIQVCIILTVTGSLKAFDHAWIITSGGPGNASTFITMSMFKKAFIGREFGYGSAMTVTIIVYALLFTYLFKKYFSTEDLQY